MTRLNRAVLVTILAIVMVSSGAWAGDGQFVGNQCWDGGVLKYYGNRPCPGTQGGRGPVKIMGPPVIVYVRPSAEGSQMPGLAPVDSRLKSQLSSIADTSITLRQKGEFAMRNGDLVRARQYLDEARRRDPGDPQTNEAYQKLQRLFDEGKASLPVPRPQLSKYEFLKPMPEAEVEKYYQRDPEIKVLREAEIIAYNKLANADANFNQANANLSKGASTQGDIDQAQSKLKEAIDEFKKAEIKLKEKIYVLDK